MRRILLAFFLIVVAFPAVAEDASRMQHVFRRRIEICLAWGGCDEEGGTVPVAGAPVISPISDQRIARNASTGAVGFTISDEDTPLSSISVGIAAEDGTLLPEAGISHACSGSSCTLTLTPATDEIGQTPVVVTASDGSHVTSRTFSLRVLDSTAPYIGPIADQSGPVNLPMGPIGFLVDDLDSDPATLILDAVSGDEDLVASSGISFGGVGASRTLTIQPKSGARGVAQVMVTATDPEGHAGLRTFFIHIGTAPTISAIADQTTNAGTPTASISFAVDDDSGADHVVVTAHSSNQDILPDAGIVLSGTAENRSLVATPTSETGIVTITLVASDGTEEASTSFGLNVIEGGTAPWISSLEDRYTPMDTPVQVAFQIGDDDGTDPSHLMVYAWSGDTDLVPGINSWGDLDVLCDASGSCLMDVAPAAGAEGVVPISVYVEEQDEPYETAETSFNLLILGNGPQISQVPDQVTPMNTPVGPLGFSVADMPIPMSLHLSATSSDESIIASSGITFGGEDMSRSISLVPVTDANGNVQVTVTAGDDDGNNVSMSFMVMVLPVSDCTPSISVGDVEATPSCGEGWNEDVVVPFTVNDPCGGNPAMAYRPDWWMLPNHAYAKMVPANSPPAIVDGNLGFAMSGEGGPDFTKPEIHLATAESGGGTCLAGDADFTLEYDNGYGTASDAFHVRVNGDEPTDDEPPVITMIGEKVTNEVVVAVNGSVDRVFYVSDDITAPENLIVHVQNFSSQYFTDSGVMLTCLASGECHLSLTPIAGKRGDSTLTVSAADEAGNLAMQTVLVRVGWVEPTDGDPLISDIPDQVTPPGETLDVEFQVGALNMDVEVQPDIGGEYLTTGWGAIPTSCYGATCTIHIVPKDDADGEATIRVYVDGDAGWMEKTFLLAIGDPETLDNCYLTPVIGTVCPTGEIYAGKSPDGTYRMYVPVSDVSYPDEYREWDTRCNCPGHATSCIVDDIHCYSTGITDLEKGWLNTDKLVARMEHPPAEACDQLSVHGHHDWYLPSQKEMQLLCERSDQIGGFLTDVVLNGESIIAMPCYWTSTDITNRPIYTRAVDMRQCGWGWVSSHGLDKAELVVQTRCVRRGFEFSVILNREEDINQINEKDVSFKIRGIDDLVGQSFHWNLDDTNPLTGTVSGAGTFTDGTMEITGIDVSILDNGTITLSVSSGSRTVEDSVSKDIIPLVLESFVPGNGSAGVPTSPQLSMSFNKSVTVPLVPGNSIRIYKSDDDSLVRTVWPSEMTDAGAVQISGATVALLPAGLVGGVGGWTFLPSTTYYVLLDPGTFQDSAGNPLVSGIADKAVWQFTTE